MRGKGNPEISKNRSGNGLPVKVSSKDHSLDRRRSNQLTLTQV